MVILESSNTAVCSRVGVLYKLGSPGPPFHKSKNDPYGERANLLFLDHLERLDPGIAKRPSRFDRKYRYRIPNDKERLLYCQYWRNKLQKRSNLEFSDEVCEIISKLTEGFSFAYMKELFVQTLLAIVGGRANFEDEASNDFVTDGAGSARVTTDSVEMAKTCESNIGAAAEEEEEEEEEEEKDQSKKATKYAIPDVLVPEHLKENILLRALRMQIEALLKDMDDTKVGNEE